MRTRLKCLLLCVMLAVPALSADNDADAINFLLDQVKTSTITFVRNEGRYDGEKASAHLRKKYEHYKPKIRTAEDFIRLAATRSELTGRPYMVQLSTELVRCDAWMTGLLKQHREREKKQ